MDDTILISPGDADRYIELAESRGCAVMKMSDCYYVVTAFIPGAGNSTRATVRVTEAVVSGSVITIDTSGNGKAFVSVFPFSDLGS